MTTQEIDRATWPVFFDEFSRQNEGAMARIETIGTDVGDQRTETYPFQGITFEQKGSDIGSVIIMLGTADNDHIERMIDAKSVKLKPANGTCCDVLEIQASEGPTTLLHIERVLALPGP